MDKYYKSDEAALCSRGYCIEFEIWPILCNCSCSINIIIKENWPMPEIPTPLGRLWSAILESTITSAFQGIRNATEACFFPLVWRILLVVVLGSSVSLWWVTPPLTNQVLVFFCSDQSSLRSFLLWPSWSLTNHLSISHLSTFSSGQANFESDQVFGDTYYFFK